MNTLTRIDLEAVRIVPVANKPFFAVLEGLRGAAAILVMFRHIISYVTPLQFPASYLAVDLFFVLSGTVIANSYETALITGRMGFREFAALRLIRIFPLYLIGSLIGLIALAASGTATAAQMALRAVLALLMIPLPMKGVPLFPLDHPAWSLFFEFFANFVYARFIRSLSNRSIVLVVAVSLALIVCGASINDRFLDLGWDRRTFLFGFPRVLFSFFLGVLIYRLLVVERRISPKLGAPAELLLLICTTATLMMPPGFVNEAAYGLAAIAIVFPLLVALSLFVSVSGPTGALMRILGELSFPLYALHVPLYQLSHVLFGPALARHAPYSGFAFAAAAIAVSLALHVLVDTPLRQRLRKAVMRRLRR